MKSRIAGLAAAAVFAAGVVLAPSVMAGSNVAVSIGLPGLSVGYSNRGFGFVAPAPFFAPVPFVTYAAPVTPFVPAPVVYAPYYRPHFVRAPVRVGYYGYARHY